MRCHRTENVNTVFLAVFPALCFLQGPLPAFSAENSWSHPRILHIRRGPGGFGLSIKGSRPTKISAVDEGSPAQVGPRVGVTHTSVN